MTGRKQNDARRHEPTSSSPSVSRGPSPGRWGLLVGAAVCAALAATAAITLLAPEKEEGARLRDSLAETGAHESIQEKK